MEKTTMNVHELAKQLGISIPKSYELTKTPGFPAIRIGSRIIIPIDEYKKWLAESSNKEGVKDGTQV